MPAESLSDHIRRMSSTFRDLDDRHYPDGTPDKTEAMWYEPWGHIFHDLRQRTSFDVSVAAQDRLTVIALVEQDDPDEPYEEEWSMRADTSVNFEDVVEYNLARDACIPDFVIYYTPSLDFSRRRILVIVEIKPPEEIGRQPADSPLSILKGFEGMILQTFTQARHAFERNSSTGQIYIMCVVGKRWWMYTLRHQDLNALPTNLTKKTMPWTVETRELWQSKLTALRAAADPNGLPEILNAAGTDYSHAFKGTWTGMCNAQVIGGVPVWV